jgi:hypothetical protein
LTFTFSPGSVFKTCAPTCCNFLCRLICKNWFDFFVEEAFF